MTRLDEIKNATDVVATHRYENGRLVATVYKSSLGEAEERYTQREESLYAEGSEVSSPAEDKPKRR
ncbi:hypothetical protein [Gracilinema caldarium]|uniref:hypothetical protein n=1 Tax=Gracilinema caldarium TaxID=215591 RepID=UPI0026F24AC0|nr:hypothetical protein [Gracilinema caldarium]